MAELPTINTFALRNAFINVAAFRTRKDLLSIRITKRESTLEIVSSDGVALIRQKLDIVDGTDSDDWTFWTSTIPTIPKAPLLTTLELIPAVGLRVTTDYASETVIYDTAVERDFDSLFTDHTESETTSIAVAPEILGALGKLKFTLAKKELPGIRFSFNGPKSAVYFIEQVREPRIDGFFMPLRPL